MGLIDRIAARLRGTPMASAEPIRTTTQEMPRPVSPVNVGARFGAASDRSTIVREARKMYREDPRAKEIIKTVARDAVKGGFAVKVKGNPRAEEIAKDLVKRLALKQRLDDWARLTFRDGDSFLELGVDEAGLIAIVTRKPTLEIHRASDDADQFPDPARAFWWNADAYASFADEPPNDAVWFAQWQIIHARWEHDEGSRYGTPMFAVATKPFKRMEQGELDMAVRRKTRAGMKFLHVVEGASEPELEAYKERNREALDDPFAAVADFFTNRAGGISSIQGDANLNQYDDVQHHIRTFFLASPVPMSLLGYGQDLNRDVLQEQKEQYDEALEQITEWVEAQMVTPILHLQWLLQGIYPESLDYEIVWKARREPTAQDISAAADAALKLRTLGLDETTVLSIIAPFIPNVDLLSAASLAGVGSTREAGGTGMDAASRQDAEPEGDEE